VTSYVSARLIYHVPLVATDLADRGLGARIDW